jgi:hypothetical protein
MPLLKDENEKGTKTLLELMEEAAMAQDGENPNPPPAVTLEDIKEELRNIPQDSISPEAAAHVLQTLQQTAEGYCKVSIDISDFDHPVVKLEGEWDRRKSQAAQALLREAVNDSLKNQSINSLITNQRRMLDDVK